AGGAGAQPEFVRLQGGDPAYPAFFDIQGDLLSWSSRSYSDRVLLTHVYRRHDGVWRLEAQLAGGDAYPGFTRIDGDRIVGWADHCDGGRIFRHDGQKWVSEPIVRRNNLCLTGDVGDVEGEWLVLRHASWYGGRGLATAFRFRDGAWRWHSHLEALGLGDYA